MQLLQLLGAEAGEHALLQLLLARQIRRRARHALHLLLLQVALPQLSQELVLQEGRKGRLARLCGTPHKYLDIIVRRFVMAMHLPTGEHTQTQDLRPD